MLVWTGCQASPEHSNKRTQGADGSDASAFAFSGATQALINPATNAGTFSAVSQGLGGFGLLDDTGGGLAQINDGSPEPYVFLTVGLGMQPAIFLYVNSTIGYVNPMTDQMLNCSTYQPYGFEIRLALVDCAAQGALSSQIGSGLRYSNGQVMRSGNTYYYDNGRTFAILSSGGASRYYYPDGTTMRDGSNRYLWPNGQTMNSSSNYFYYPNGASFVTSGVNIYYQNGQRFIYSSDDIRYLSGSSMRSNDTYYYQNRTTVADSSRILYPSGRYLRNGATLYDENGYSTYAVQEIFADGDSSVYIDARQEKDYVATVQTTLGGVFLGSRYHYVNSPPVIAAIGNRDIAEKQLFTYQVQAVDPNNARMSYSLSGASGATINSSTGVISWTPTHDQAGHGYTLTVTVTDQATPPQSAQVSFHVNVLDVTPPLAVLSGYPAPASNATQLNVQVSGNEVNTYSYKIVQGSSCDGVSYPAAVAASHVINDSLTMADGALTLCVVAYNVSNLAQLAPTTYTWIKDTVAPASPQLSNLPAHVSPVTSIDMQVSGPGVVTYKYALSSNNNCSAASYSSFQSVALHLVASLPAQDGAIYLCVVGADAASNLSAPTLYGWIKDTSAPSPVLTGLPSNPSKQTALSVTVGPADVVSYAYQLVAGTACNPTGYLSFLPNSQPINLVMPAADGTYSRCVLGRDAVGNAQTAPTVYTWVKDTAPPAAVQLSHAPAALSNATSLAVTVAGAEIYSYVYAVQFGSSCPTDSASYSASNSVANPIVQALPAVDGTYSLCVIGSDQAGNAQTTVTKYSWLKDTTPPVVEISSGLPATYSADQTINAVVKAGDVVNYAYKIVNGNSCQAGSYSSMRPVATPVQANLPADGQLSLCIIGVDQAGNADVTPYVYTWVKDTVPPFAIISGTPESQSNVTSLSLQVGQDSDVDTYAYQVVQGVNCPATGYSNWQAANAPLQQSGLSGSGPMTLCVVARDKAGNIQPVATAFGFVTGSSGPMVQLSGTPAAFSNVLQLAVHVSSANFTQYAYQLTYGRPDYNFCPLTGYSNWQATSAPIADTLVNINARFQLCVVGRAADGTTQVIPTRYAWQLDTIAPTVSLQDIPAASSNATSVNVRLVLASDTQDYAYQIVQGSTCPATGYSAYRAPGTPIQAPLGADGVYTLCVIARDAAGNVGKASSTWTKDTVAPTAELYSLPLKISHASLAVSVGGTGVVNYQYALTSGATCNNAAYSSIISQAQPITGPVGANGQHTICVRGIDTAGNVQGTPTAYTWVNVYNPSDVDGDGRADVGVYRTSTAQWFTVASATNTGKTLQFGASYHNLPQADIPVTGDYDGDGKMDIAVFRPSTAEWFIINSHDGSVTIKQYGAGNKALPEADLPIPADYDGDGKTDIAVYRTSTAEWFIVNSHDGSVTYRQYGAGYKALPTADMPVVGDYDGDGRADIAVFRPSTAEWFIVNSHDGSVTYRQYGASYFNLPESDTPIPADYDGDGKTDIAIFRASSATWFIINSSNGSVRTFQYGASYYNLREADTPIPADYDGDGKADIALFRPSTAEWFIVYSRNNAQTVAPYGASYRGSLPEADLPLPGDNTSGRKTSLAAFKKKK